MVVALQDGARIGHGAGYADHGVRDELTAALSRNPEFGCVRLSGCRVRQRLAGDARRPGESPEVIMQGAGYSLVRVGASTSGGADPRPGSSATGA